MHPSPSAASARSASRARSSCLSHDGREVGASWRGREGVPPSVGVAQLASSVVSGMVSSPDNGGGCEGDIVNVDASRRAGVLCRVFVAYLECAFVANRRTSDCSDGKHALAVNPLAFILVSRWESFCSKMALAASPLPVLYANNTCRNHSILTIQTIFPCYLFVHILKR